MAKKIRSKVIKSKKAKLVAYGSFNLYEINGKAYYRIGKNRYLRAVGKDYLIKK